MKTNNEIVKENIDLIKLCCSHQVRKYDTPVEFLDDIIQDLCIILLEYDTEKLNKINADNHLNSFITGILVRQLFSTNSQTYRTYRRLRELSNNITEDVEPVQSKMNVKKEAPAENLPYYPEDFMPAEDDDDYLLKLKDKIMRLGPGERNIFLSYCETPNVSFMARKMKCPQALLNNYLNNVKNKLKFKQQLP